MGRHLPHPRSPRLRLVAALALTALVALPAAASAHPLGNFTINHYAGLTVRPDAVELDVVLDMAEIPTFQERQRMDANADGEVSEAEFAGQAEARCGELGGALAVTAGDAALVLAPTRADLGFPAGTGGLSTLRLECGFVAALAAPIVGPTTIGFRDDSYAERLGWREVVVVGAGVTVETGDLPTTSPSARLTAYPEDLLAAPLDIRSAEVTARPGGGTGGSGGSPVPVPVPDGAAVPGGIGGDLPAIFRATDLTPAVALLALVTALGLGAFHALTPGHGKTLMAAYLVGTRGTAVHAVGLGLAVTVSHTLGILVLAGVVVGAEGVLPPEVVVRTAPVVAAITILGIGGWMLLAELRRRRAAIAMALAHPHNHDPHRHDHDHPPEHGHEHGHDRGHDRPHDHEHDHEPAHDHERAPEPAPEHAPHWNTGTGSIPAASATAGRMAGPTGHGPAPAADPNDHEHSHGGIRHSHLPPAGTTITWRGLFALGLAGGLIPSTSALLILLGSIAAGRPAFGIVLVVAFGLGMAIVMTGVGLVMVVARSRLDRLPRGSGLGRLAGAAPLVASVVVLALGIYLTAQALGGATIL